MATTTLQLTAALRDYLLAVSLREPDVARALREETGLLPEAVMQVAPEQAQFMALLVKMIGALRVIEVGTFTGYSALIMAMALPEEGRLITCDISESWTRIAQRHWQRAGVDHKIDLRLAPASVTLQALRDQGEEGRFDLAFLDADKVNLSRYYEHCLALLRRGGVMLVDNVLWSGRVIEAGNGDEQTAAIHRFNRDLHDDPRVEISMLAVGDGVTLALKR